MNPLLEQFLQEARENLAFIDQNLSDIGGDDPELLNSVFRAAHTLKGGSGIVGFESVKDITHSAEDLLDMLRASKIEFKPEMVDVLYDAFDEVLNLIEAAEDSEDIVDADEDTKKSIVKSLNDIMGKDDKKVEWSCPLQLVDDPKSIINMDIKTLKSDAFTLHFEDIKLDENTINDKHLFAVNFDIDTSCMVFGNDPIYTLSLLGDSVIYINTTMSEDGAKNILSGLDDEEGLNLCVDITAFIYASYEEIEDSLFNFMDELRFLKLDANLLLDMDVEIEDLDILIELKNDLMTHIKDKNQDLFIESISKTLELINSTSIAYKKLLRLKIIAEAIDVNNLNKLNYFVDSLSSVASKSNSDSGTKVADKNVNEALMEMFRQQLKAIESNDVKEDKDRIISMLSFARAYDSDMPENFESIDEIKQYINKALGLIDENSVVEDEVVKEEKEVIEDVVVKDEPIAKEEKVVEAPKVEPTPEVKAEVVKDTPAKKPTAEKEVHKKNVIGKTVKIDQDSIDHLMNIVGELLVAKNSLPYLADGVHNMNSESIKRAILEKYTFINRLSEQLQDLIMGMRMLPISYVFDRYPKLVRDISKNLNKKVTLKMDGGETKLDKNIIEMMADPMIHIMRNSLDHGIELPEVRKEAEKDPVGLIELKAYSQSDKIIIEIKDDGAGINVEKVIQKVLEKELLTLDQIDALSDNQKAELVMLPGLSTADEISEYSGRGVGMDVVRKSIEGFGGTISISTSIGKGTTITLTIPVSLAVTSLLHVSLSEIHYGFPMESVSETVKISKKDIELLHGEQFIYLRGEVIPLLFVESMLDKDSLDDENLPIVVLNIKGNLLAVVVNELLGQLDVVQKPLEGVLDSHPLFSGTALLGNGQIIMVLDPLGMLGLAHEIKIKVEEAS